MGSTNEATAEPRGSQAMNPASNPVLMCDKICAFYGRIQVLFDISLILGQGEAVAVLGPNGAGKSSLLGAIGGLVQSRGSAKFNGIELSSWPVHQRAKSNLSFVPEGRKNLFPSMSVRENLEIGLQLSPAEKRPAILESIVELFPILRERMTTAAGMLSGGEQQMLAIGVALGREPKALMMDEPSQGLAPAVFDILERAIGELRRRGIAVLLAEQNLLFASRIADRFMVISHGHVVAAGDKAELENQEYISDMYFGAATH